MGLRMALSAPFKALEPDGLHATFYHKSWHYVGTTIGKFVLDLFVIGILPQGINDTLIVLIPKVHHPKTLSQLRLISLCNVAYKTITKLKSNSLKKIMPWVTSPTQSIFVPSQQIIDNIIIYQEVLHSM